MAEGRVRYRRDWYRRQEPVDGDHPVSARVDARMRADARARTRIERIRELGTTLARELDPELLPVWLELEALWNARAHVVAAEHYNEGVEAGLAYGTVRSTLEQEGIDVQHEPARALRALAETLERIAEQLPR